YRMDKGRRHFYGITEKYPSLNRKLALTRRYQES
ncbi:MAG: hypothetical protein ACI8ZV_000672, partial [Chitinophagales bacterium]